MNQEKTGAFIAQLRKESTCFFLIHFTSVSFSFIVYCLHYNRFCKNVYRLLVERMI